MATDPLDVLNNALKEYELTLKRNLKTFFDLEVDELVKYDANDGVETGEFRSGEALYRYRISADEKEIEPIAPRES